MIPTYWQDTPLAPMRLRELRHRVPLAEWEWDWHDCEACGIDRIAPSRDGYAYDGDPVVCVSCGAVACVAADEDGAHVADPHGLLTDVALAGLRRLLCIHPIHSRAP